MNSKQLSERIGNIDELLIQQAESVPNYGKARRKHRVRRIVATAAVLALMVCSCAAGALAFGQETVIETIVEVPVEQEMLELKDIGITLILPDSWKGKYAMEANEYGEYHVYSTSIRDAGKGGGILFYIMKWGQQITEEQWRNEDGEWNFAGNRYIMTTKDGTYLLYYASDMQCAPDAYEEYRQMEKQVKDIRFIVDAAL
ncbi:MAG: hypothetical protein IKI49_04040 [Oscillospiraceae bacterium]|nr:hypothetical protein [Oscillospiraceae bacterium]